MKKKKICIITGTRAEWGLLSGLARKIKASSDMQLQIIATNMHLSERYGMTFREIESDGFTIDVKIPMLQDSDDDSAGSTVKAVGRAMTGFSDAFQTLSPDLIVILGDRYEMIAAASAALIFRIPIAHLHGGEITEGAFDDSIRHAITKMSCLHFTATEEYRERVIQMGESPDQVFYVGALGCENIRTIPLLSQSELEQNLDFQLTDKCFLVTYHPVTLDDESPEVQVRNLLKALDEYPDYRVIFTQPNSDTSGQIITRLLKEYENVNPDRVRIYTSLGIKRYLSMLKQVTAVIGNSSSGILEVPSFGIPTVNIGDRQKGRISADSVIHCGTDFDLIRAAINQALSPEFRAVAARTVNPYDKSGTSEAILKVLRDCSPDTLIRKHFHDFS